MNTVKTMLRTGMLASLLLLPLQVLAHTDLKVSAPADGAVLHAGPASVDLEFTANVRLIKLEISSNGQIVKTDFKPAAANASSYSVATPGLGEGSYTVNWAVIGEDGHTVTNTFAFTVNAAAAESHGAAHGDEHAHGNMHAHEEMHAHGDSHGDEEARDHADSHADGHAH